MTAENFWIGCDFADHGTVTFHHSFVIRLHGPGSFANLSILPCHNCIGIRKRKQPVNVALVETVHQTLAQTGDHLLNLRTGRRRVDLSLRNNRNEIEGENDEQVFFHVFSVGEGSETFSSHAKYSASTPSAAIRFPG